MTARDQGSGGVDDAFRARLRAMVERSGLSLRALSRAIGRDAGYLAALLDPSRPSRARPTPADLVRMSDATAIPFVELLEALWGIDRARLAAELPGLRTTGEGAVDLEGLDDDERREVGDFIAFLVSRRGARHRRGSRSPGRTPRSDYGRTGSGG